MVAPFETTWLMRLPPQMIWPAKPGAVGLHLGRGEHGTLRWVVIDVDPAQVGGHMRSLPR